MYCSGCGKNIPFGGQVCPHCQHDKSSDQQGHVAGMIALVVGGAIGNVVAGFTGMIVGALSFAFVVAIVSISGKGHSAKKPPRVRIDTPPKSTPKPPAPPAASANIGDRLRRLDQLKSEGLISEAEHEAQRSSIIAALKL